MSEQAEYHMPATGEAWRHYKMGLYTIIGMARDDEGHAVVVYTEFSWGLAQLAPIYVQRLGRFVQEIENGKPRFKYERPAGIYSGCQYIKESSLPSTSSLHPPRRSWMDFWYRRSRQAGQSKILGGG